jgi:hypothetical protein
LQIGCAETQHTPGKKQINPLEHAAQVCQFSRLARKKNRSRKWLVSGGPITFSIFVKKGTDYAAKHTEAPSGYALIPYPALGIFLSV